MAFVLASDIAGRIRELCDVLGLDQKGLAARAGVRPAQVGNWLQGRQRPAQSRLDAWARRERWSLAIFEEDGPRPATLVNRPVAPSNDGTGHATGGSRLSPPGGAPRPERAADRAQQEIMEEALRRAGDRTSISYEEHLGWLLRMLQARGTTPPAEGEGPSMPEDR